MELYRMRYVVFAVDGDVFWREEAFAFDFWESPGRSMLKGVTDTRAFSFLIVEVSLSSHWI
jgi:hypothetical protein